MDKGKGKETETRQEEQKKIVMAQWACESLHSWGSHRKEGDKAAVAFYPDLF